MMCVHVVFERLGGEERHSESLQKGKLPDFTERRREQTNAKRGPKGSWAKEMTRSEEKGQIHRLRTYLQLKGIEHE